MSVITRFAPSPTGYLHIGGARTALFNYLFAKNNGGKFLLRIEDTDKDRSTKSAIDAISQGLDWLGLKADDDHILQSQNLARHKEIVEKLLEKNQAYYCYTPLEELNEMRQESEKKGQVFRFKSPWRDKKNSQDSTVKPVVRIKAPQIGESVINDLVQGQVRVQNSELDDLIMLRSNQTPTYMLAVVVDDHDMGVTHVIRGDDHLNNAFRQKVIYDAMGWKVPEFAHIPLIHGADGAKMSKRHGATSVIDYKEMGYLPQAMRNYLLRLGWSHGNDEIISDAQAIEWFDLKHVGKSPSRFDFAKLENINKHYLKSKTGSEIFDLIKADFANDISTSSKNRIIAAAEFLKDRASLISDLTKSAQIYLDDFTAEFSGEDQQIINEKKSLISDLQKMLSDLGEYSHDEIKNSFKAFAEEKSLKIKDFGPLLRVILTFSSSSAGGIFKIVEILGKSEVLRRIELSLKN